MQPVNCPLCRSNDFRIIAEIADYSEPFRNVVCQRCALVYANPQPTTEELTAYYERQFIQGRHQVQTVAEARERAIRKGSAKKYSVAGLTDGLNASSRVLEIGCSYGFLLNALKGATGCQVFGVEPSKVSGQFAQEEFGISVYHGSVEAYLAQSEEKFDLIIIYHVLEHLADPVSILKQIRHRLTPTGRLYVCVPDVTHLQEPPESFFQVPHLLSFSPWSLHQALWAAGLKPISFARKLLPPKNGMECMTIPAERMTDAVAQGSFMLGSNSEEVAASIRRVRRLYGALRRIKRTVKRIIPRETLERVSLRLGKTVRAIRDRSSV